MPYGLLSKIMAKTTYLLFGFTVPEVGCDEAIRANQSNLHPRFACAQVWPAGECTQNVMWKG